MLCVRHHRLPVMLHVNASQPFISVLLSRNDDSPEPSILRPTGNRYCASPRNVLGFSDERI
jgi:hypothetical protein